MKLIISKSHTHRFKVCKILFREKSDVIKKYFIIITLVKHDSPRDFIYFYIYVNFYCIISILLLTNFIHTNLCPAII